MDNIKIVFLEEPELQSPIMVEGLPGVGNVGKLAAEHLLEQVKATKFADIYSKLASSVWSTISCIIPKATASGRT
jgi:proteasome assembly chaperone (PAC2) family protein